MASSTRFVFLGTGTSERVPRVSCVTRENPTCPVCTDALKPGSRNYRRNTSLLVQARRDGGVVNIVVDAGKSFYEAALSWFPEFGVTTLDAVVITHAHADAIAGIDDLRDWTNTAGGPMPMFVRDQDMKTLSQTHFYIIDPSTKMSGGGVAKLDVINTSSRPFDVRGVEFVPLPVEHGKGFSANGYRIADVCYIPDVSSIPDSTRERMQGCNVLVLDALRPERTHGSHLSLEQAIALTLELRPPKTLFTGMAHDIEHDSVDAMLAKLSSSEGLDISLAYDGLSFERPS